MVYGNYDPAYIQPVCDLCGKTLEKRYKYTPTKIEVAKPTEGVRTSEHEGHLCSDCNQLENEYPVSAAKEIQFHFMGHDPATLLMVDILGTRRAGGNLYSIYKFGPDEAPEFLRLYGAGIVRGSTRSVSFDDERIEAVSKKYANALDCSRGDGEPDMRPLDEIIE